MSQSRTRPPIQRNAVRVKMEPRIVSNHSDHITMNGIHSILTNGNIISTNDASVNVCNGIEGKRRKYIIQKSTPAENNNVLYQQWNSSTTDGSVVFKILNQPEIQHRARYQTEGSRGAIKDRSGTGYPTVQIDGYRKVTKIQIFIGNDQGKVIPHMFYQVCRVTGKNSNPCEERKVDGTDVIEIPFEPHNDMTVICDCVGILKERFADVEARFPKHKTWRNAKKKSTKCRLVFRTVVENLRGEHETLQVVSDVINCTQLPGTPEILKMSALTSQVDGGGELWIIGKNFLKDTRVIFSHSVLGKREPLWTKFTDPEPEFFHQTHLIVTIPPFYNIDTTEEVEVSVFIKCGDKLSDPTPFTYKPNPVTFNFTQSVTQDNVINLPRGVAAPAVAINQQFAKTGSVSVISGTCEIPAEQVSPSAPQPRPTILEPLHDHKNKKSRIDFAGRQARRTRSVPRPNLINEDTVLFSEEKHINQEKILYTNFSQSPLSPWKGIQKSSEHCTSVVVPTVSKKQTLSESSKPLNSIFYQTETPVVYSCTAKRSFSNDEDSNSCNYSKDSLQDEASHMSTKTDLPCSLTTDFSNVFTLKNNQLTCDTASTLAFTNINLKQQSPEITPQTSPLSSERNSVQSNENTLILSSEPLPWKEEPLVDLMMNPADSSSRKKSNDSCLEENHDVPNVSLTATHEDKATISISLPTSILKDQEHFKSVIETINNTLLKQTPNAEEEIKSNDNEKSLLQEANNSPVQNFKQSLNNEWVQTSPKSSVNASVNYNESTSPKHQITSMPVSVLTANTRKRNFSSEPAKEFSGVQDYVSFAGSTDIEANIQTYDEKTVVCQTAVAQSQSSGLEGSNITSPQTSLNSGTLQLESHNLQNQNVENSVENNAVSYHARYIKPITETSPSSSAPISETYGQWTQAETTMQEKKWNAEFNEVLQTVFEETKDNNKETMEWVQGGSNKSVISETSEKESMDWNPASIIQSTNIDPENILKDTSMEWAPNVSKQVDLSENTIKEGPTVSISYLVQPSSTEPLNTGIMGNLEAIPISTVMSDKKLECITDDGSRHQVYQENTMPASKNENQGSSPSEAQQIPLTEISKSSVEFLHQNQTMSHVQQFDQFTNAVQNISSIEPFSSEALESTDNGQGKQGFDQNQPPELALFEESQVQIQGDPLLSETSSVIGAQQDIENVTLADVVYKSDIPKDQQWVAQQASEWTYNSTS